MSTKTAFRWLHWPFTGPLILATAFVGRVFYSSYTSEWREFVGVPSGPLVAQPEATGVAGLRNVSFPRRGDSQPVAGWYVPAGNDAVVILAHGTSSDRTTMLAETRALAAAGFGVLAFDWPGYGASPGVNNWGQSARDALVGAIDWLVSEQHITPEHIGGLGFSMGGYLMTQVAADEPRLHAVVLAAPVPDIVWQAEYEHGKWGALSRWPALLAMRQARVPLDVEPPIRAVRRIAPRPLLLLVGADDHTVPAQKLREMFDAAAGPKDFWIVPGAGHGDYAQAAPSAYARRITGFFSCHLLEQCPP